MRQRGRAGCMYSGSRARRTCSRKSVTKHRPKRASARRTKRGFWPSVSYSYTPTGETHPASVAVRLRLLNPGAEPWTLAGAALVDSAGEQVELARWPLAPIPANGAGAVVVGIKGERAQLGCPCTLKRWEAQGPRTFTLETERGQREPCRVSRGCAPANLRESLVDPFERVQVRGVVQVERRARESDARDLRSTTACGPSLLRAARTRRPTSGNRIQRAAADGSGRVDRPRPGPSGQRLRRAVA